LIRVLGSAPVAVKGGADLILGIDPGLRGSFALLYPHNLTLLSVHDAVSVLHGTKNQFDAVAFAIYLDMFKDRILFAVVEDVTAMKYTDRDGKVRGQGAAASFSFGRSAGVVDGVLAAYGIVVRKVRPVVWKTLLGLSASKSDSISLAKKKFPDHESSFKRQKDDGRAEAALLAWFGADRFYGAKR
jgi:crossover junction endodeoxyribonuclease RuvC